MGDLFCHKVLDNRKETEIQKQIMDYLHAKRVVYWRNNNIPIPIIRQDRIISYRRFNGAKGAGDIFGFYKGKFFSIEVKSRTGKPSNDQLEFIQLVKNQGHIAFIARSIEDVDANLFKK
jgi:penicillin-binding protein-related factor A (putative recombinase)